MKTMTGVIHGSTIELSDNPGLPDGETVEVRVRSLAPGQVTSWPYEPQLPGPPPGWYPGCTVTAAGSLAAAWTAEDDRILTQIERDRELATGRELSE